MRRLCLVSIAAAFALLAGGCTSLWQGFGGSAQRQGVSSSLVDFLHPRGEVPPAQDAQVPTLKLPLKVGLAFVPSRSPSTPGLSEAAKNELLGRVRSAFGERDYIREIVIIPDTYLRGRSGFDTIDQVARLYGLDVVTLVSYDQVVHTEDTRASLLYWTIVGAYFIKGSRNDVQTFVDAAVFDVPTRKLLFRAPGIDRLESTSTLINSPEETRKAREKSFATAMADMTQNLGRELEGFRERVKTDQSVQIVRRDGARTGGGAAGPSLAALLVLMLPAVARPRRRP